MRILGFVGSMRKDGKTSRLVQAVLDGAKKAGDDVETEVVYLSDLDIGPCHACYDVCAKESYKCVIKDDLQMVFGKMKQADAIVLSSALYFIVPSRLVAFMERLSCVAHLGQFRGFNEHPLEDKPCGLVAVSAETTVMPVLVRLQEFAFELRMRPVAMKSYPFLGVAGNEKMEKDKFLNPLENAETLGELLVEAIT
ncbi:MAG TPA: flavodoxin family protein [bacterium]|nr:flavodoxin family protein [bacterium]